MKIITILLLLLFFSFFPLFADNLEIKIVEAVRNMEISLSGSMVVGVGNIVYSDKNIGSPFSHLFKEKLYMAIQNSRKFELSEMENLDLLLKEMEFQLSDLVDQTTTVKIGMLKGVQGLISGSYYDNGTTVNVFLKLVKIETGTILYTEEIVVSKRDISVSILPDNYNDALSIIDELSDVSGALAKDFIVKAWIQKGNGATYKDGEELKINFFSSTDCYIKVFHIDVDGQVQLIFPNRYYTNNLIRAKTIYKISDSRYPFKFKLHKPFGTEFIKVMASTLQFKDIEEAFTNMGIASSNLLARGLSVEQREEQITELLLNYTIIE